mgnify:CR=1 FL=1
MSGDTIKFLRNLLGSELGRLHTALPCRLTAVSGDRASAVPLVRLDGNEPAPLLVNLPLLRHRYRYTCAELGELECTGPHYEAGDKVLVVFLERPLDAASSGRRHDLSDGGGAGLI